MSFRDEDRIELARAQHIAEIEGKLRVSVRANGKEYTYAKVENSKGSVRLWLVFKAT